MKVLNSAFNYHVVLFVIAGLLFIVGNGLFIIRYVEFIPVSIIMLLSIITAVIVGIWCEIFDIYKILKSYDS